MLDELKRTTLSAGIAESIEELSWITEEHLGVNRNCDPAHPRPSGTKVYGAELVAESGAPIYPGLVLRWYEANMPMEACESDVEGCALEKDVDYVRVYDCPLGIGVWEITFK